MRSGRVGAFFVIVSVGLALAIAGCGRRRTVVATAPPPSGGGSVVVAGPAVASSGYVPTQCGLSSGSYGALTVGGLVVLGRHSAWTGPDGQGGYASGDDNWAYQMDQWVGQQAVVTELSGVDSAGCPGVRVTVDGGQFFWRIRDMQVLSPGGGGGGYVAGGGGYLPPQCGMSSAQYGPLGIGAIVILGRHSAYTGPDGQGGYSSGDDNWAYQMDQWVGSQAVVTSFEGLDSAGCPVVHVNIDGGQYYWRIRDMQLVSAGGGGGGGAMVPTHCGMSYAEYGVIQLGSTVILGRHTAWAGDDNWAYEMDRWVGSRAVVTELAGLDSAGCPGVRVTVDGGQYFWRIRDMRF